ncbi:formate hydrogenlyase complex iron-sulfur subunit [Chromobacterium amazonense]|uniref:formate hydrogenlyase complex iron-sulfur subunit n=1 Tax=Chromobacterium amazonense TaxID=1382803 RepID=UPI003F796CFF
MFKLFKIIAKAGEPTTKYPFAPFPVSPGFRGKPELNARQCIACAACTQACPAGALTMQTDSRAGRREWALNLGRCIFCGRCEEVCPTRAIQLTQEFELAVACKDDLIQRASFRLENCACCGKPFTPLKEVHHVMDLLRQSGLHLDDSLRGLYAACPECKRKQTIERDALRHARAEENRI